MLQFRGLCEKFDENGNVLGDGMDLTLSDLA